MVSERGEYRVKITVRNNLLLSAIEEAGYSGYGGIGRFAEAAGISRTTLSSLLSMRSAPLTAEGEFSAAAKQIMEVLGASPSDLWSADQLTMCLNRNTAEAIMNGSMVSALLDGRGATQVTVEPPDEQVDQRLRAKAVGDALELLTKREQKVVRMRFGIGCEEMTLEDVGSVLDVTRERARQIERRALQKLRNPNKFENLRRVDESTTNGPEWRCRYCQKVGISIRCACGTIRGEAKPKHAAEAEEAERIKWEDFARLMRASATIRRCARLEAAGL